MKRDHDEPVRGADHAHLSIRVWPTVSDEHGPSRAPREPERVGSGWPSRTTATIRRTVRHEQAGRDGRDPGGDHRGHDLHRTHPLRLLHISAAHVPGAAKPNRLLLMSN